MEDNKPEEIERSRGKINKNREQEEGGGEGG
jgi:hypothetical protein